MEVVSVVVSGMATHQMGFRHHHHHHRIRPIHLAQQQIEDKSSRLTPVAAAATAQVLVQQQDSSSSNRNTSKKKMRMTMRMKSSSWMLLLLMMMLMSLLLLSSIDVVDGQQTATKSMESKRRRWGRGRGNHDPSSSSDLLNQDTGGGSDGGPSLGSILGVSSLYSYFMVANNEKSTMLTMLISTLVVIVVGSIVVFYYYQGGTRRKNKDESEPSVVLTSSGMETEEEEDDDPRTISTKQHRNGSSNGITFAAASTTATSSEEKIDLAFDGLELLLDTGKKKEGMKKAKKKNNKKLEESNNTKDTPEDTTISSAGGAATTDENGIKSILDGSIRGRAKPGRLLAIMGPSGAGKSSVLHALAGRIKHSSKLTLYGQRYVNGIPITGDTQIPSAFIQQETNFFPHMTVKETLEFRVELKLGKGDDGFGGLSTSAAAASRNLTSVDRDAIVHDLLDQLGLHNCADTIVGNEKVRGISGGERKRLSIAVEMISSPPLIFLDEPTSGLDSTAATTLVRTLRSLADNGGKTIVAVIHQPSQHVFSKFDDLLLVSEGKLMYYGEVSAVRSYMDANGCSAAKDIGTAEHILDCISRMPIEDETVDDVSARMDRMAKKAASKNMDLGILTSTKSSSSSSSSNFAMAEAAVAMPGNSISSSGMNGPRAGLFTQFKLLMRRSFQEVTRGKLVLFVKAAQQITTAIIYGGIYTLGTNQASIQDRFGLLSLIAIGASNMAVAQSIRSFPREKAIVSSELASKMYWTLPYFIGKALSELPLVAFFNGLFGGIVYHLTGLSQGFGKFRRFMGLLVTHGLVSEAVGLVIGAFSPNSDIALAVFPAILVLNIVFDGRNISEENTPKYLRWIPKIGVIRWGYEGLCVNEFDGLTFDEVGDRRQRRGPGAVKTGADALARFGLTKSVTEVVRAHLIITASCWFLSYIGLTLTRERFLIMKVRQPTTQTDQMKRN